MGTIVVTETSTYSNLSIQEKEIAREYYLQKQFPSFDEFRRLEHNGRLILGNYFVIDFAVIKRLISELPSKIEITVNEIPLIAKSNRGDNKKQDPPLIVKYLP